MDTNQNKAVDINTFQEYLNGFNGKDTFGSPKAIGSYQLYAAEDDDNSRDKQTIYKISKAEYTIVSYKLHPQFIAVDIRFNSFDDTELKLLWSRLSKFKRGMVSDPDKTWIFNMTLLDTGGISTDQQLLRDRSADEDTLHILHLVNPVMSYLTRENPTDGAMDRIEDGELLGGNIVRLLFTREYVQLEISADYNTQEMKAEVMREAEAEEYINNYTDTTSDEKLW